MKALLVKDIQFNLRYIISSFLIAIIIYSLFCIEGGSSNLLISVTIIPIIIFNLAIGKLCFMDDRDKSSNYLEALPFKKDNFVAVKFLEGILILAISLLIIILENYLLKVIIDINFKIDIYYIISSLSFLLIYIGAFFIIYYKYNYQMANQLVIFFYIAVLFLFKFIMEKFPDVINLFNYKVSYLLIFIISLSIYYIFYKICIKLYKSR